MEQIKYRNMLMQVVLLIVTLGFYSIYWFFQSTKELKSLANDSEAAPALWTVLLFIPPANIYSLYKHSELYEKVCSEKINKWILWVLWMFCSPVIWFLVQSDLNRAAGSPQIKTSVQHPEVSGRRLF